MVHGMGLSCPERGRPMRGRCRVGCPGGGLVSIVMGLDQHRAQISAEWIDTVTGEVSRARVAPADRDAVRAFVERSSVDEGMPRWRWEATTGWRPVVEGSSGSALAAAA